MKEKKADLKKELKEKDKELELQIISPPAQVSTNFVL